MNGLGKVSKAGTAGLKREGRPNGEGGGTP